MADGGHGNDNEREGGEIAGIDAGGAADKEGSPPRRERFRSGWLLGDAGEPGLAERKAG